MTMAGTDSTARIEAEGGNAEEDEYTDGRGGADGAEPAD